ncbi:uncharacterized protein BJX67DRAFT_344671 [Aspergillus lucknowensis]|uniref:Uncharacterized protein n=1 Tax=Aspergillus lucknowensis TaxID=176173 RepID=A0ABR4M323_9EURO
MPRPWPNNIRKWSCLHSRSSLPLIAPLDLSPLRAMTNHLPSDTHNNPRPFHSHPPSLYAAPARSPAALRAQQYPNAVRRPRPIFSSDALPTRARPGAEGDLRSRLRILEKTGLKLMSEMLHDGIIDKSVTPKKFKRAARALLENAFTQPPSKDGVAGIARDVEMDVDSIFEIGRTITRDDRVLSQRIITSCALAGAKMALFLTATHYLRSLHNHTSILFARSTSSPARTSFLDQIETLATSSGSGDEGEYGVGDNRDPRAMLIHAKALGLQRRYAEGLALVEEVMLRIEPTRREIKPNEDITVSSGIEPPWELYLWLRRALKGAKKVNSVRHTPVGMLDDTSEDEMSVIRLAAVDYQNPAVLEIYADIMKQQGDFKKYEQYMGQAAAAGNRDAGRKLGNLYYLIFSQRRPRPGESGVTLDASPVAAERPKGFLATLLSYFGPRPLPEYRGLAMEWYRVAWASGCVRSGLNLAILSRQDGHVQEAEALLDEARGLTEGSRDLQAQIQRITAAFALGESQIHLKYLDL